jgi:hypothetical protein
MAIMALFRSPRVDKTVYDAIIEELDLESQPGVGALTHACGFDENGVCVCDVWESRQDFEAFLSDRLRPAFARLNLEFEQPTILDAYAFNVSDDVDRYKPQGASASAAGRASPGGEARPV